MPLLSMGVRSGLLRALQEGGRLPCLLHRVPAAIPTVCCSIWRDAHTPRGIFSSHRRAGRCDCPDDNVPFGNFHGVSFSLLRSPGSIPGAAANTCGENPSTAISTAQPVVEDLADAEPSSNAGARYCASNCWWPPVLSIQGSIFEYRVLNLCQTC